MLPPEVIPFLESGLSTLLAACDEQGKPTCVRGIGLRVLEGGRAARVYLPGASARLVVDTLRDTRNVAVTMSRPITHRTVQIKGRVLSLSETPVEDRASMEALFCGFMREVALVGMPPGVILRILRWPSTSVDFSVEHVFVQTPGPGAGSKLERGDVA